MAESIKASSENEFHFLWHKLDKDMLELYRSPVLNADSLRLALGYKSLAALYQSISKERIPIPVFTIENRKGKYALVSDVAKYLAQLRLNIKKVNEEVNHG